jgi:hypothetical protein
MVAGCGANCVKYLFFTFNFLVFLSGGAVLGVSLWARFDKNFQSTFNSAFGTRMPPEMQNMYIVLYVMMGVGAALILCGGLGCLGACCESPCLLGTFFAIILILFLAEIAGAIYIFVQKDKIKTDLSKWYKDEMVSKYSSDKDIAGFLDTTQTEWKCCGATGCSDYMLPPSSCGCTSNLASVPGCIDKLYDKLKSNMTIVAIVLACLVAVELLAMIFSCILCTSMRYE